MNTTEIVHSEMKEDGRVKVYIETPDATKVWITQSGHCILSK